MKTYIFLDFDGVLRTNSCPKRQLTKSLVNALANDLKDIEEPQIVISSTWREVYGLRELKAHLGSELGQYVIDITPTAPPNSTFERQRECYAWLRAHAKKPYKAVAIDDNPEMFRDMKVVVVHAEKGYQEGQLQLVLPRV